MEKEESETNVQTEKNKTETKAEGEQIDEPEEPCDPTTMTCDEMRDRVLELSDKRSPYIESIKKLDEVKKVIPSDEISKAYDDAVAKKQDIDDEIYSIFEKFTVCTTKSEKTEETNEETTEPEV